MGDKLLFIVGNRPQYIKLGILLRSFKKYKIKYKILNTGQHYDKKLSKVFFKNFGFFPDYNLKIGSGENVEIIAKIIFKLNIFFNKNKFNNIVIFGDTNTTLSTSIVAAHKNLRLFHIESGERSFYRNNFPEEINRVLTDHSSNYLFACSMTGYKNLISEGFHKSRIFFSGDILFDLFKYTKRKVKKEHILKKYNIKKNYFYIATIHRVENTNSKKLYYILNELNSLNYSCLLFAHPRLMKIIQEKNWLFNKSLKIYQPIDYNEMNVLLNSCINVFTDSGGLKKEAFFAKKISINIASGIPVWSFINKLKWCHTLKINNLKKINSLMKKNKKPNVHNTKEFGYGKSSDFIAKKIKNIISSKGINNW